MKLPETLLAYGKSFALIVLSASASAASTGEMFSLNSRNLIVRSRSSRMVFSSTRQLSSGLDEL